MKNERARGDITKYNIRCLDPKLKKKHYKRYAWDE